MFYLLRFAKMREKMLQSVKFRLNIGTLWFSRIEYLRIKKNSNIKRAVISQLQI